MPGSNFGATSPFHIDICLPSGGLDIGFGHDPISIKKQFNSNFDFDFDFDSAYFLPSIRLLPSFDFDWESAAKRPRTTRVARMRQQERPKTPCPNSVRPAMTVRGPSGPVLV